MLSVKRFIHDYFQNHKEKLALNYPGLKVHRLVDEFITFHSINEDDIYTGQGEDFLTQISNAIPLEYIQNKAYFYRSSFFVDNRVLIPRSESEILVENALKFIHESSLEHLNIAEIGIGSFALGLSILIDTKKSINFWGGDISDDALDVAKINLFRHEKQIAMNKKIQLEKCDRLIGMTQKFDLILTNPPYIKEQNDLAGVHHQTISFEPHLALFLPDDLYDSWFDLLFKDSATNLNDNGLFVMEGHEDHLRELAQRAEKYFKNVEIIKDYTGRDRFLHGR